ncbi:uncharacterized protein [Littorina saxatilis]|uniref:uncharacterized protein n=1 Tax=Littorina saxatilis TaxID=31220 RepID=UPI0038B6384F
MAKTVTSVNKGPLLLTIVNEAYLPLTFNWLCHTAKLPGVHEKLIFLVQGKETEVRLNQRWPNIKTHTVNQTQNELSGPLKFGTVGYIRMMVRRTELLNALVQANISFLLFETDFIWFENPVPDFIKLGQEENLDLANNTGARYGVVDYEIVVDGKWYKMKAAQRKQFKPKAIHNNFLHNAVEKLHRFRRFGHWVLDSNLRCNTTTVDRLLRRRK